MTEVVALNPAPTPSGELSRPPAPISVKAIAAPAARAILRLWKPFVLIQLCGLGVVVSYFNWPAFQAVCDRLAAVKVAGGYLFSACVMAFVGGVVPELTKYLTGVDRSLTAKRLRDLGFAAALFAVLGVIADAFYRLMAYCFGTEATPLVVMAKVACDQLLFAPTLGCCTIALAYAWRDAGYSVRSVISILSVRWYLQAVGGLLVACWFYWVPMCFLMYALPTNLTFIFGATASAASTLIFIAVASEEKAPPHLPDAVVAR